MHLKKPLDVSYGAQNMFTTETTVIEENFIIEFYEGFLSGMNSVHNNYYEDRTFTFEYTIPSGFRIQLSSCRWEKINNFDQVSNF